MGALPAANPLTWRSLDRRRLGSFAAAVLLLIAFVGPVRAHAELETSDPADGAVLQTPPTAVNLTFTEDLDASKSNFRLVGPGGTVGTGRVADDPGGMRLEDLDLAPGDYQVRWTAVADDGHVERGIVTFTVAEPTPPPATQPPATSSPATPQPISSESPSATPAASLTDAPTPTPTEPPAEPVAASGGDVLLPIVAALILVAIIGGYMVRRSRQA